MPNVLPATSTLLSISVVLFSQVPQNQFTRIPLWLWILAGLVVVAIGVIWTLWEEGELKKKQVQPALAAGRALTAEDKPIPSLSSERDDLKQVHGIGPKIAQILNDHNIFTFEQLAATDINFLESLMAEYEWHMADPATWAAQARTLAQQKRKRPE